MGRQRKYFGTDGIRGRANVFPMTVDMAMWVGMATGHVFRRGPHRHRVVIGKDTRLSGYMLESALTAGLTSMGMDVCLVGPAPTPAIAFLTRSLRADLGIMISASHNPYTDNGIKLFDHEGYKLCDAVELEIEEHIHSAMEKTLKKPEEIGRASRAEDSLGRYLEFVKSTFPRNLSLRGVRIVVDCAHGAAYKVAPEMFWEMGAEVVSCGVEPDGFNINRDCGSTSPERMCALVRERRADIGIAFDGDADRLVIADEHGRVIHGDQILAFLAHSWQKNEALSAPGIVGTILSSLALERYIGGYGLRTIRTPVGDRYVSQYMREHGFNLGGEHSGHIVLGDFATTGDALIAALQVLALILREDKPASECCRPFEPLPLIARDIPCGKASLGSKKVREAIRLAKHRLGSSGRLVVRKSGTEPLFRVVGEGDDEGLLRCVVEDVSSSIERIAV